MVKLVNDLSEKLINLLNDMKIQFNVLDDTEDVGTDIFYFSVKLPSGSKVRYFMYISKELNNLRIYCPNVLTFEKEKYATVCKILTDTNYNIIFGSFAIKIDDDNNTRVTYSYSTSLDRNGQFVLSNELNDYLDYSSFEIEKVIKTISLVDEE